MKQYTVQAPDGKTITLEGPEGASNEEVIAQAQKLYQPQGNVAAPAQAQEATPATGPRHPLAQLGEFVKQWGKNIVTGKPEQQEAGQRMMEAADPFGMISGASSVGIGSAVKSAGNVLSGVLKRSAQKGMAQTMGATTVKNKALTERVVAPGLLERGTVAATRAGLEKKALREVSAAGDTIDDVLGKMDPKKAVDVKPIMQAMKEYRDAFRIEGSHVIGNTQGHKNSIDAMDGLIGLVKEQGRDVSFKSLRSLRKILDSAVEKGSGFYGKTVAEGSMIEAQRELAGAIRSELAKSSPDLAKVNAEYSFWKKAHQVIRATNERTQAQAKPLSQKLITAAGLAGGIATGDPAQAMIILGASRYLPELVQSPAWRMVSAQTKNRMADMIASGKVAEADGLARLILAGGKASSGVGQRFSQKTQGPE
jgi:hypothetical protein